MPHPDAQPQLISVSLSPDEFANVQDALEHYANYMDAQGARGFGEDFTEVRESLQSAIDTLDVTGEKFFGRSRGITEL